MVTVLGWVCGVICLLKLQEKVIALNVQFFLMTYLIM